MLVVLPKVPRPHYLNVYAHRLLNVDFTFIYTLSRIDVYTFVAQIVSNNIESMLATDLCDFV